MIADSRIDALLASMTLEQKVAQMIQPEIRHVTPDDIRRYGFGSVLNGGGAFPGNNKFAKIDDWLALADAFHAASVDTSGGNAGIPIMWGTDAVHGHNNVLGATLFPHNIGLGATGNPQLVADIAAATAREVKATGIDWIFAPTVAVAQDLRWGRTYESYGADPQQVASFAGPMVRALQAQGVIATAKHFIGDGGTLAGEDQGDTRLPLEALLHTHGAGYAAAIDAGVWSVMASFSSWNGDKVHGNRLLLTEVLRDQLGFTGLVVSDWNGHGQVRGCRNDSCAQAINAGIDIVMVPRAWRPLLDNTVDQVRTGLIPEARVNEAVRRILAVKFAAGIMDRGAPSAAAAAVDSGVGSAAHRRLAREAVRQSLVLLKNERQVLPLAAGGRYIVAGPAADDIGRQSGGWTLTWQGTGNRNDDFPGATSIRAGIEAQVRAAGGAVIAAAEDDDAVSPDAVIYVFGETPYAEGQGDIDSLAWQQADRTDWDALRRWRGLGVPVVGVYVGGRPRWINAEINQLDALLVAWLPGSEGAGVADVLFTGDDAKPRYEVVGRLPFAWPAEDVHPIDPKQPVEKALFPAGYGLAFTDDIALPTLPETANGVPADDFMVLIAGSAQPPFALRAGPMFHRAVPLPGSGASDDGALRVDVFDYRVQEDARRLQWMGQKGDPATLWLTAESPVDLSRWMVRGGVLAVQLRFPALVPETHAVKRPPSGPGGLSIAMHCGADCEGRLATARLPDTVLRGDWVTLAIPLSCFDEAGADIERVTSPLALSARGPLVMDIADVRITQRAASDAIVWCPFNI